MIPYQSAPHPLTRLTNSQLAMWLFLSSEVMFFGSLFAVLFALRSANPGFAMDARQLAFYPALFATGVLLASSVLLPYHRVAAASLGVLFLALKTHAWYSIFATGVSPATSNFWGMFFVLSILHALHLIGGIGALLFFRKTRSSGVELYWHFVDLVWVLLFAAFYLF